RAEDEVNGLDERRRVRRRAGASPPERSTEVSMAWARRVTGTRRSGMRSGARYGDAQEGGHPDDEKIVQDRRCQGHWVWLFCATQILGESHKTSGRADAQVRHSMVRSRDSVPPNVVEQADGSLSIGPFG